MASLNPKLFDSAGARSWQQTPAQRQQGSELKAGRARPLSSLAHSVRNTAAVVIDAVMGRYDR